MISSLPSDSRSNISVCLNWLISHIQNLKYSLAKIVENFPYSIFESLAYYWGKKDEEEKLGKTMNLI